MTKSEIATRPIEDDAARAALEAMLHLRQQMRKLVGSAEFARSPIEQRILLDSLLMTIENDLQMLGAHHQQLVERMNKLRRSPWMQSLWEAA